MVVSDEGIEGLPVLGTYEVSRFTKLPINSR